MFPTRPLRMQATQPRLGPLPKPKAVFNHPSSQDYNIKLRRTSREGKFDSLTVPYAKQPSPTFSSHSIPAPPNPQEDPPRIVPSGVAVGAATYSLIKKLRTDKTLRLSRPKPEDVSH
ncbi:hypothetical protein PAAG_06251 [Paracoccidioides lutzii Pb01]|uniref:Uncharacterized protein n=1 Tax=Paracoccidioides lutzii (strain ATCC MYA-826 / Pb01) TaxID=502779 RepID=C1H5Q6_PARBA|nr:hypothetical protein PAAG_06251 [Paracoccidioides lutzii Pb01]EEH35204.2 hypothetical protein PAAG_06251 [Paracoccidioides lutzii Pb01]